MRDITLSPLITSSAGTSQILLVESGSLAGQRFVLPAAPGALLLGRERLCNVRFDPERDRVVGRTHARIEVRSNGIYLVDLSSANGTFRGDGTPVRGETLLRSGERFQLGGEGGPWLSLVASSPAAVHLSPAAPEMPTLLTPMVPRRDAVAPSMAAEQRPSPGPNMGAGAAAHDLVIAPLAPPPQIAKEPPETRLPGPQRTVATEAAYATPRQLPGPEVDLLALQHQRSYRRQVLLISLLLVVACLSGLALGLRDSPLDESTETSRSP